MKDKEQFIADYLNKHMRNVNEPLHGQYLKVLAETEENANKAWIEFNKKRNNTNPIT